MKKLLLLSVFTLLSVTINAQEKAKFPEGIAKVLKKHGGINTWNKFQTLSYHLKKEKHTIDLHSRKTTVVADNYALGFDGDDVWITKDDPKAFKKDPTFYYNLFFYFYGMPFVLADDGIIYTDVEPLVHEGVSYPGIKIGYEANIGVSPDDNYFIYYHPETHQMEWLGYTVTYFSKKESKKVKMIRYNNWEKVNGVLLPKVITWHKKDKETGVYQPIEKVLEFKSPVLSNTTMEAGFYKKPTK